MPFIVIQKGRGPSPIFFKFSLYVDFVYVKFYYSMTEVSDFDIPTFN